MATATCIRDAEQLDAIFERSNDKPVYLFKHSLTCPISRAGWNEFETFVKDYPGDDAEFAYIEIQNTRELSKAVTDRTKVKHESPQAIKLVDGDPVWNASHGAITVDSLQAA